MTRLRTALLIVASVLRTHAGQAQIAPVDTLCSYERCAIWLDRSALRRGAMSDVVLRDGFFRPMRLAAFVGGADSATIWAQRFDARAGVANRLSLMGALAIGIGIGTRYLRVRHQSSGIDDANGFEASLVFGGYMAVISGAIVRNTAQPFRGRAIWWYNRRFARSPGS